MFPCLKRKKGRRKEQMLACRDAFEAGLSIVPTDSFLQKGAALFHGGCKVKLFHRLCLDEIDRYYSHNSSSSSSSCCCSGVALPYSLQSGWINNVSMAKCMVLWVLNGRRQSGPTRLNRIQKQTPISHGWVATLGNPTPRLCFRRSIWTQKILDTAWNMLQHCLSWPYPPPQGQELERNGKTQATTTTTTTTTMGQVDKDLSSSSSSLPVFFYPSQVEMAERLYRCLFPSSELLEAYEKVDFRILLPPSTSLQSQTAQRLMEVFPDGGNVSGKVLSTCMFRCGRANAAFRQLEQDVMEVNPATGKKQTLMVIIADECHFGVGKGGQADVLFHGAPHSSSSTDTWPNPACILLEDNVYIVRVSATGWNCLPGFPADRTVVWDADPPGYTSWRSYAAGNGENHHRLRCCAGYQSLLDYFRQYFRGGCPSSMMPSELFTLLPSLVLMVDYALGLLGSPHGTLETQQIVRDHLASRNRHTLMSTETTVIRVQQNGAQGACVQWLQYFLARHPSSTTVVVDVSEKSSGSEGSVFEQCLRGRRSFCILVEKGRFGDSIPGIRHFDLRARYHSDTSTFSSLLQDVGRCFGYHRSSAPLILLNPQGYQLFTLSMGGGGDGKGRLHVDRYLRPLIVRPNSDHDDDDDGGQAVLVKPHRSSMWFQVVNNNPHHRHHAHVKTNQVLFMAQPQEGKTGVYLRLLQKLVKLTK